MAEILDYFDTINIDVAKRKYYNANKVNAVLADLRSMSVALVDENEKLRAEVEALQKSKMESQLTLDQMQTVYRDTLSKARERADAVISEAEDKSAEMTATAEQKAALAAEQLEACIHELRVREEQNIDFLNARLQQYLEVLKTGKVIEQDIIAEQSESADPSSWNPVQKENPYDEKYFAQTEGASEELRELELRISRLAREINALESGI